MPPTAETQASSPAPAIPRFTGVRGAFEAGSIFVCRAADRVAVHFGTRSGRFVFIVSEKKFLRACRGEVDSNGVPFRSLEEIEARPEDDDAALAEPAESAPAHHVARLTTATGCALAWEYCLADLTIAAADAAARAGVTRGSFTNWITAHHQGELTERRRAAGLSLKPRRVKLAPLARGPRPLLKPSGRIL